MSLPYFRNNHNNFLTLILEFPCHTPSVLMNGSSSVTKCNKISILPLIMHGKSIKLDDHYNPSPDFFFCFPFFLFCCYFRSASISPRLYLSTMLYCHSSLLFGQNLKLNECVKQEMRENLSLFSFCVIIISPAIAIQIQSNSKMKAYDTQQIPITFVLCMIYCIT